MTTPLPPKEPSIHDYPWLAEELGLDLNSLGAVMLPVRFREGLLERGYELGIIEESDLHVSPDPSRFWIKGDVSEKAHITLLYGLLQPAYTPEMSSIIRRLLAGWRRPTWLPIVGFEAFPSPFPDEPYACIVALVGDTDYGGKHEGPGALKEARGRLEYLPHINTYPEWKLHATIAYVEVDAAERWMQFLSTGLEPGLYVPMPSIENGAGLDLGGDRS